MFKMTRRKLVILNALVFFVLLNGLGTMVYFYTRYTLYHQVDRTLIEKHNDLIKENGENLSTELSPERDENEGLIYLLWSRKKRLTKSVPEEAKARLEPKLFSQYIDKKGLQTVTFNGKEYRLINIPLSKNKIKRDYPVQKIQVIYNLQRENEMLGHLLLIISFGSILSIFIAIIAGIFLASRALVPIRQSWEKQQQFVADASHELRTPFAVMKLNLEYLFRHPDRTIEEESTTILQVIQELDQMAKMTSDLLTLARSDSNQLELRAEVIQLDSLLNQVVQKFKLLGHTKKIEIEVDIGRTSLTGDRERLRQLFVILLDNALKYTEAGGHIQVNSFQKNNLAIITIQDTGVGISTEDLPFIFDRYYRGDKSRNRELEGSGLGLSIAKWIVEAHNGKIQVDSQVGNGTHVTVSLPVKSKKQI